MQNFSLGADSIPCQCSTHTRRRRGLIALGNFLFRYRDYLFPAIFLCLIIATRPGFPFGSARLSSWLDAGGLALAFTGQVLRVCVFGLTDVKRGGDKKRIAAERLLQDGLFAHARNPLYLGNLLIVLGLTMIMDNVWGYLFVFPIVTSFYFAIVVAEEDFLHRKFGRAYLTYCQHANRFLPRWAGLWSSLHHSDFNWKQVIKREFGTLFAWVSMALVLLIWERCWLFGYMARQAEIHLLLSIFPLLWIIHLYLIGLKKAKRLR